MKKLLIIPALALALVGCNATTQSNIAAIIASVQTTAVDACKFLPAATTIAAIVTANQSATAAQIASVICGAVNGQTSTPTAGAGPMYVTVNGTQIAVTGYFIK